MSLHDLWAVLWVATWPNNTAALEWAAAGAIAGLLARDLIGKRLAAWWAKHHPHTETLAEIRENTAAARRIAADMYEHHTGEKHPDAPAESSVRHSQGSG